jgi:hypothetical protein
MEKKIIIIICGILLTIGCKQEKERRLSVLQKENMEIKGILPSGEDVATKTTLDEDGLLTLWEEGDAIGVYGNGSSNVSLTLTSGAGTPFGVFKGTQTGVPLAAYYPYTQSAGNTYTDVRGFLDSAQVQNENAHHIAPYDWKVSSHVTGNDQDGYRIHFREIMTLLNFTIDVNGTALVGEHLQSVTFCVPDKKLAGNFAIDLGTSQALPAFDDQATNKVCVRWETTPLAEAGNTTDVVMFVNASVEAEDLLQITLETENHTATTTVPSAKTMKAGHRYHIPLSLSELSDQTTIKEKSDPGDYNTFGIYRMEDTLITYRQFADQWSILAYDTHYDFRIQNYAQKKVVTISGIPLDPQPGSTFSIEINVLGVDNIAQGSKNVTVARKEGNLLLLYDQENQTSYLVYN